MFWEDNSKIVPTTTRVSSGAKGGIQRGGGAPPANPNLGDFYMKFEYNPKYSFGNSTEIDN